VPRRAYSLGAREHDVSRRKSFAAAEGLLVVAEDTPADGGTVLAPVGGGSAGPEKLVSLLDELGLSHFKEELHERKVETLVDLLDLDEQAMVEMGMPRIKVRKLRRKTIESTRPSHPPRRSHSFTALSRPVSPVPSLMRIKERVFARKSLAEAGFYDGGDGSDIRPAPDSKPKRKPRRGSRGSILGGRRKLTPKDVKHRTRSFQQVVKAVQRARTMSKQDKKPEQTPEVEEEGDSPTPAQPSPSSRVERIVTTSDQPVTPEDVVPLIVPTLTFTRNSVVLARQRSLERFESAQNTSMDASLPVLDDNVELPPGIEYGESPPQQRGPHGASLRKQGSKNTSLLSVFPTVNDLSPAQSPRNSPPRIPASKATPAAKAPEPSPAPAPAPMAIPADAAARPTSPPPPPPATPPKADKPSPAAVSPKAKEEVAPPAPPISSPPPLEPSSTFSPSTSSSLSPSPGKSPSKKVRTPPRPRGSPRNKSSPGANNKPVAPPRRRSSSQQSGAAARRRSSNRSTTSTIGGPSSSSSVGARKTGSSATSTRRTGDKPSSQETKTARAPGTRKKEPTPPPAVGDDVAKSSLASLASAFSNGAGASPHPSSATVAASSTSSFEAQEEASPARQRLPSPSADRKRTSSPSPARTRPPAVAPGSSPVGKPASPKGSPKKPPPRKRSSRAVGATAPAPRNTTPPKVAEEHQRKEKGDEAKKKMGSEAALKMKEEEEDVKGNGEESSPSVKEESQQPEPSVKKESQQPEEVPTDREQEQHARPQEQRQQQEEEEEEKSRSEGLVSEATVVMIKSARKVLKHTSHYNIHGKIFTTQQSRLRWNKTAEVLEIEHYKDMPEDVHTAMWYTLEEWTAMEEQNLREIWDEQLRAEMERNGFIDPGFEFDGDYDSEPEWDGTDMPQYFPENQAGSMHGRAGDDMRLDRDNLMFDGKDLLTF